MGRSALRVLAIVLLIALMVLLGVPAGFGMAGTSGAGECPGCGVSSDACITACPAVLFAALVVLAAALVTAVLVAGPARVGRTGLGRIERPPRSG